MTVSHYPPCPFTEIYPILQRIPPAQREAYVRQAEAGIELTEEQNAALGFHASLPGGVLLPADMSNATSAQIKSLVDGDKRVLGDILLLAVKEAA